MTTPESKGRPGKPSLIAADATAAPHGSEAGTRRMLDGIGAETRAGTRRAGGPAESARSTSTWVAALAIGVAIGVGAWWWGRDDADTGAQQRDASVQATDPATAAAVATTVPATAAISNPLPVAAASAAASSSDAAVSTARIETQADTAAVASPATDAPVATAAPSSSAASAAVPPLRAARSAPVPAATPPRPAPATVATATPARPRLATASSRQTDANGALAGDPDVTLLTAMLARLSGDGSRADVAAAQATIAQLVERCESRLTRDSIESFECRQRICAGYWGKADACPIAMAPKGR